MPEAPFRLVRKGYEPGEVDQRISLLESTIERLQTDLNRGHEENAVQAVECAKLRHSNSDLAARVEMLEEAVREAHEERDKGVPPTFENLGVRIGQMLTLAQEEANELRDNAERKAHQLLADAEQESANSIQESQRKADEAISLAQAEAARTIEEANQRADQVRETSESEATARLEEAEAVYEAQRAQAAEAATDFERTLAERRDEAMAELNATLDKKNEEIQIATEQLNQARSEAERETAEARAQAAQIIQAAQTQATGLVSEAKQRAEGIRQNSERELAAATARRDSITAQLANVRQMLATLGGSPQQFLGQGIPQTAEDWASLQEVRSETGKTSENDQPEDRTAAEQVHEGTDDGVDEPEEAENSGS